MNAAGQPVGSINVGFIGLGDMGAPMANNLISNFSDGELNLTVFDIDLQADKVPVNAVVANTLADIAANCEVVFISVPDGTSSLAVVEDLLAQTDSMIKSVINLSTVGIDHCEKIVESLPQGAFDYIDAPVSGGKTGAINATITIMWSGSEALFNKLQSLLSAFAKSLFFVGAKPGQGQALKLLNNYLSGVAMTATSEAVRFGLHHGLDLKTMLDVVHVSTGQNTAISDKFPKRILTESYDAGFRMKLMEKDISLYRQGVAAAGVPSKIVDVVSPIWMQGVDEYPDGDFTEIFKVIDVEGGD